MPDVNAILSSLREQLHLAEAEVKEINTFIARLEMMGTVSASLTSLRTDRANRISEIARIKRMINASLATTTEDSDQPVAFVQRAVATTRSELPELQVRVKELRVTGKLKGRKSRLPLEECYDMVRSSPQVRSIVAEQFWSLVDKSETHGECWLVKEKFKRGSKKSIVKAVYVPALGCKIPAVRLCSILIGIDLDESSMRNTCGEEQCVKPAHFLQGRERDKRRKKETRHTPSAIEAPAPLEEAEDYQQYVYELLADQREEGEPNVGLTFRDAEKKLVPDMIPNKDAMIKAIRLEKFGKNQFYLNADSGRLYLTGFPRRPTHQASVSIETVAAGLMDEYKHSRDYAKNPQ